MAFQQDLMTGVRRGAMLFAVMLAGIAIYRIAHAPSAQPMEAAVEAVSPVMETTPDLQVGPPVVPPPPPLDNGVPVKRSPRRHASPMPMMARPQVTTEVASETPAAVEQKAAPVAIEQPQTALVDNASTDAEEPGETSAITSPQKHDTRRMRWIKAVGRFLRVNGPTSGPDSFRKSQ